MFLMLRQNGIDPTGRELRSVSLYQSEYFSGLSSFSWFSLVFHIAYTLKMFIFWWYSKRIFVTIMFVRTPVNEDSPNRPEEQPTASVETPRTTEIDESRRRKLREIELKVAEYAQKLEAKGASNIAQQCDVFRAKLLEVSSRWMTLVIVRTFYDSFTIKKFKSLCWSSDNSFNN